MDQGRGGKGIRGDSLPRPSSIGGCRLGDTTSRSSAYCHILFSLFCSICLSNLSALL